MNKEELLAFAKDMGVDEDKALQWYENRQKDLFGEPVIKKSKNPHFAELKKIFLDFYKEHYVGYYQWRAKDSIAINSITKIIVNLSKSDNTEDVTNIFKITLNELEKVDKFTFENLSLALLNSRFGIIISKIQKFNLMNNYKDELKRKLEL